MKDFILKGRCLKQLINRNEQKSQVNYELYRENKLIDNH